MRQFFRDVAATLDPTSVHFRSLTDPQAQVLEQNYEFDLVSADKLLQKYIDQKITVHVRDGKAYEGILLSYDSQRLVLAGSKDKGPIFLVERGENVKRIQFSKLPEGLLTRPTLVWEVEARQAGKHLVEVSYIAQQVAWRADYNGVRPHSALANLTPEAFRAQQIAVAASAGNSQNFNPGLYP